MNIEWIHFSGLIIVNAATESVAQIVAEKIIIWLVVSFMLTPLSTEIRSNNIINTT